MKHVPVIVMLSGALLLGALMLFAADFATAHRKAAVLIEYRLKAEPVNQQAGQYYWHEERVRQGDSLAALVARLPLNSVAKAIVHSHLADSRTPLGMAPGTAESTRDVVGVLAGDAGPERRERLLGVTAERIETTQDAEVAGERMRNRWVPQPRWMPHAHPTFESVGGRDLAKEAAHRVAVGL